MPAAIPYAFLRRHYPTKEQATTPALYERIGHHDKAVDRRWENSCALRVSLALVGAKVPISPGFLTIKAEPDKGKRIETRQRQLSEFLLQRLGKPEIYFGGYEAWKHIRPRHGIISFFHLNGLSDPQGHIDLVEPATMGDLQCAHTCYWSASEVWFWPLN